MTFRIPVIRYLIAALFSLVAAVSSTKAADELLVYVFSEGKPVGGADVLIDENFAGQTAADGSLLADIEGDGGHILAIKTDTTQAGTRFTVNAGQLVDVIAQLDTGEVYVDVYSQTESVADQRSAPNGLLNIRVTQEGQPVAQEPVYIAGYSGSLQTDSSGDASVTLKRGRYRVQVAEKTAYLRVVGGLDRSVVVAISESDETMEIAAPTMEEVFVTATFDPSGLEVSERDTANIVDTIGVELLARFSDSDVAASVVRVPGISVQDDKYVFIRGLGGRYVSSTLNNATMPSTNPSKRTVPLDLFPSNFVNQLDIKKTFLPYMPGESTGGNLVINTKTFPDERAGSISASLGYVSDLTGNTVAVDPADGGFDLLGWDDGAREEDIAIKAIAEIVKQGTFVDSDGDTYTLDSRTRSELLRVAGVLLNENWDPSFDSATPNGSFGVNYGDLFYINDAELGFYSAVNYSNDWSKRDNGIRRSYTASGNLADDLAYKSFSNNIDISGLVSVGLNWGSSTFEWNNFLSRSTESFYERSVGQEGDEFETVYQHTSQWEERQYASTQILGSHMLSDEGSVFAEWQFTASQARRYVPGRTEVRFRTPQSNTSAADLRSQYDFGASNDAQTDIMRGFTYEAGNSFKRYDDLIDNNFDLSFDLTWDVFDSGASFSTLQFGFQAIDRDRRAESATYGYFNDGRDPSVERAPNTLVSDVIYTCGEGQGTVACPVSPSADGSVVPPVGGVQNNARTGYIFAIRTAVSDEYTADLSYNSVYAMYDHTFNTNWQVIVGGRYEVYDQTTDTFDLTTGEPVQGVVDEASLLPSLGVNWFYTDNQQLRFAVSQTVARPDFKEASNAVYFDNEFNVRIRGNKDLTVSDVLNADLRWEWYFGDNEQDTLSVAAFYKEMTDPIERVVQPASGTAGNTRTFQNSDRAELYGVEIEGRKEFVLTSDYTQNFFVSFNAAYIESEVTAENQITRTLQGQPEFTSNLVVGYDNLKYGHQLTLLYNHNGESIADVGVLGAPDVYLEQRGELNLVYRYDISDAATIKARIANLLDQEVEYTQGGQVFQRYDKGTTFQLGFDWKF